MGRGNFAWKRLRLPKSSRLRESIGKRISGKVYIEKRRKYLTTNNLGHILRWKLSEVLYLQQLYCLDWGTPAADEGRVVYYPYIQYGFSEKLSKNYIYVQVCVKGGEGVTYRFVMS